MGGPQADSEPLTGFLVPAYIMHFTFCFIAKALKQRDFVHGAHANPMQIYGLPWGAGNGAGGWELPPLSGHVSLVWCLLDTQIRSLASQLSRGQADKANECS